MDLTDLRKGITNLLTRATLSRPHPEDHEGHAEWTKWVSEYLYQFVIRSRQKGIELDKCHRHAVKATERVIRNAEAERILAYELPLETTDERSNVDTDPENEHHTGGAIARGEDNSPVVESGGEVPTAG